MGRLGVVGAVGTRWRVYAGPAVLLLAVTIAVALVRSGLHNDHPAAVPPAQTQAALTPPRHHVRRTYVVRAGDTIEAISTRTGVPQAKILALNPKLSPTALFIGERLRLP